MDAGAVSALSFSVPTKMILLDNATTTAFASESTTAFSSESTTAFNLTSTLGPENSGALEKLIRAIVQCFLIIFLGYLAGRFSVIGKDGAAGINAFVGKFALPALLFKAMSSLDLKTLNWSFLAVVFVAKSVAFFAIALLVGVLFYKRASGIPWGLCGLAGIFVTQSNDFAFGLPIIQAVYSETHPEYASYLYVVAPVSLCALTPIGIVMMEIQRKREAGTDSKSTLWTTLWSVFKGVFGNPIVLMTMIGLIGNLFFTAVGECPKFLVGILQMLGDSFGAPALFVLGYNMVGKIGKSVSFGVMFLPAMVIGIKLLALPLVLQKSTDLLFPNETELATFSFLYGTFPTAPTVFVIALQYGIETQQMAIGLVLCTFLAAPLMFLTANIFAMKTSGAVENLLFILTGTLGRAGFIISIISLIFCFWTFVALCAKRLWRSPSHIVTMMSCISIAICSLAVATTYATDGDSDDYEHTGRRARTILHQIRFGFMFFGIACTRLLSALTAFVIAIVNRKPLPTVWRILIGSSIVIVVFVGVLIASVIYFGDHMSHDEEVTLVFEFGYSQAIASILFLSLASIVVIVSSIVIFRGHFVQVSTSKESTLELSAESQERTRTVQSQDFVCASDACISLDIKRHLGLIIVHTISMLIGLSLCVWRLDIYLRSKDSEDMRTRFSSDFFVAEFIDYVFSLGLGFFVFLFFGLGDSVTAICILARKIHEKASQKLCEVLPIDFK